VFHSNFYQELYDVLVPKNGVVQDIVDALIKKAQLDDEEKGGPIRIYECHSGKIHKEPSREAQVLSITDFVQVVAERIPEEDLDPEARFIQAYHFQNEPSKSHGIPFRFLIKPDEVFSDTTKRLEKRTGMKGKNFEKIKFAIVKRSSYQKPTYLADGKFIRFLPGFTNSLVDDVLFSVVDPDSDQLGLDHIDRTRSIRNGAGDLFLK
jgi:ubiquitin carboxyl-terminal hydrolase 7